jgi:cellulose synthase/poly-beta-1,6-N-acetylglucosamine synthase-like glycosyltransferase
MAAVTRPSDVSNKVTVVVAVRNEEQNILNLLNDLNLQTYPYLEIIVVDDHSTDKTRELVSYYCTSSHNTRLLLNQGDGKKQALTTGIHSAQGVIMVTTDADCRVPPGWIESINSTFDDAKVQLAFGLVRMEDTGVFENIQAIEFASIMGTGIGAFGLGHPVFCNGANLSFRKTAFVAVDGYKGNLDVPSGDDEFLLRKILAAFPGSVRLLDSPSTLVTTRPNPTLGSLFNQRIRWAGKWTFAPLSSRVLAVTIVMIHMCLLAALSAMLSGIDLVLLPAFWVLKMAAEYYLISSACRVLKVKLNAISFLVLQLTYSLYVVSIGILSNFTTYQWKERTVSPPVMKA